MKTWAWVIGGSDGLGFASAKRLLQDGWSVVLSARPGKRLDLAVSSLSEFGEVVPRALTLGADDLSKIALEVDRERGGLGAVVLGGGGPPPSTALELSSDALDAACRLVLQPALSVVTVIGREMADRGEGVIVLFTSSGVSEPIPGLASSNIVRAGVTALMKTASRELAASNVRAVCVAPGRIDTERVATLDVNASQRLGTTVEEVRARSQESIALRRYGRPEEFAAAVSWLCSTDASYVTGVTLTVDGGKSSGLLN